jgi:hypothetical protein
MYKEQLCENGMTKREPPTKYMQALPNVAHSCRSVTTSVHTQNIKETSIIFDISKQVNKYTEQTPTTPNKDDDDEILIVKVW